MAASFGSLLVFALQVGVMGQDEMELCGPKKTPVELGGDPHSWPNVLAKLTEHLLYLKVHLSS